MLIDLYLSPTEEESVVKRTASDFFIPLIKFIKNAKDIRASVNIPLSTLELLDKFGFQSLISEIKQLRDDEKIELVGTAAYSPLLTELSVGLVEKQIILNEYALGYYFGAKQGFEGEPSILIKDVEGFVPTLGVVDGKVLNLLHQLDYKWVYIDGICLPEDKEKSSASVFNYGEGDLNLVRFDEDLGKLIRRFSQENLAEIERVIISKKEASDGAFFIRISDELEIETNLEIERDENNYKKMLEFVELFLDVVRKEGLTINCVRDVVKNSKKDVVDEKSEMGDIQKKLKSRDRNLLIKVLYGEQNGELKSVFKAMDSALVEALSEGSTSYEEGDYSTICIWQEQELSMITDNDLHTMVCLDILLSRFICHEKYVYSYLVDSGLGDINQTKATLCKYVTLLKDIVKYRSAEDFTQKVQALENKLVDLLKL